jgi:TonB family protein
MMRACCIIASGILIVCTFLYGQESSSTADPAATALKTSESETGVERTIYTSGFETLNGPENPDDLGRYPEQTLSKVRSKWYPQIPDLQKSNGRKPGIVVIDFEIKRDGSLERETTVESAGDAALDAAASLAILASAPFDRLPGTYHAKALEMREYFGYDQPATAEAPFCNGPDSGAHSAAYALHHVGNGVTMPKATYSPDPEFSETARKDKYSSIVMVAGTVDPQGAFTDLCVAQAAGKGLDEKALAVVTTWKFQPATLQGEPVAVRINVEVSFRLY